jgi:GH24 family phage-related lysozyme (muramidase)
MKLNSAGKDLIAFLKHDDEFLLETRKDAEKAIKALVHVRLTNNQYSALLSFIMSEGIHTFKASKLLKLVNARNVRSADQFDKYIYSIDENGQRIVDTFLVRHRELEKALFLMPELLPKRRKRG